MWSEVWLGGQSRSGVENGMDGWLRQRDSGRALRFQYEERVVSTSIVERMERRDLGDLCRLS